MKYVISIFFLCLIEITVSQFYEDIPKTYTDVLDRFQKYDYNGERHRIISSDGYETDVFNIDLTPMDKYIIYPRYYRKPVVLLVINYMGPTEKYYNKFDIPLVFHLADGGYNVWLAPYRSNWLLNRNGKNAIITAGATDIDAVIKYIQAATKQDTISIVGRLAGQNLKSVQSLLKEKYQEVVNLLVVLGNDIKTWSSNFLQFKISSLVAEQSLYHENRVVAISYDSKTRHYNSKPI